MIDDLYILRKNGLISDGEYGKGNQTFKEIRSIGLLQDLKDSYMELKSKELSLEGRRVNNRMVRFVEDFEEEFAYESAKLLKGIAKQYRVRTLRKKDESITSKYNTLLVSSYKQDLEDAYYNGYYGDVIDEMSDDPRMSDEAWQDVYDWGVEKGYIPAIESERN
jgi:hypothetical protein